MGDVASRQCRLCGADDAEPQLAVSFSEIWSHLHRIWGAQFSEATRDRNTPCEIATLWRCANCGLDYFWPATAGDVSFYSELTSTSPAYYVADKWEFELVCTGLQPSTSLLDIACGPGNFIAMAARSGVRAVGLDTNPDAVADARAKSRDVRQISLFEFAKDHRAEFDCVTAFQTIEHLETVLPFAKAARDCVRRGGRLYLSVPSRRRRRGAEFEPLDYPPHHLSRWDTPQMEWLAKELGCSVKLFLQPLTVPETVDAIRAAGGIATATMARRIALKTVSRLAGTWPASRLWQAIDVNQRLQWHGHCLLAAFSVPDGS